MAVAATTAHGQNWFETQKIVAADRDTADRFSQSVSISGKGKPLSAYEFAEGIANDDCPQILNFIEEIVEAKDKGNEYTQEELEELVEEPI